MPAPHLYQRIIDGDELALRDAYRHYGAAALELAQRIVDRELADDVVAEAFLLVWSAPERWASPALDVHLLRVVRDLALAVRRRRLPAALTARDLAPAASPDASLPDIVREIDHADLQRAAVRLPNNGHRILEDAWFEGQRADDDALNNALEALADELQSGRLQRETG